MLFFPSLDLALFRQIVWFEDAIPDCAYKRQSNEDHNGYVLIEYTRGDGQSQDKSSCNRSQNHSRP
jgi:hypothetical protein